MLNRLGAIAFGHFDQRCGVGEGECGGFVGNELQFLLGSRFRGYRFLVSNLVELFRCVELFRAENDEFGLVLEGVGMR